MKWENEGTGQEVIFPKAHSQQGVEPGLRDSRAGSVAGIQVPTVPQGVPGPQAGLRGALGPYRSRCSPPRAWPLGAVL